MIKSRKNMGRGLAMVLAAMMLAVPSAAFAQGSSVDTYGGAGGETQAQVAAGEVSDPAGTTEAPTQASALPFTGLDVAFLAGGGLLLIGAGIAMTRLVAGRNSTA